MEELYLKNIKGIYLSLKKGYDVTDGVTVGEAEAAFLEVKKREAKEKAKQQSEGFELPFGL